jgi:hypothetical protein
MLSSGKIILTCFVVDNLPAQGNVVNQEVQTETPEADMAHTAKMAAWNEAILAYEDALSDFRRVQAAASDGDATECAVDEAREEVDAARFRFDDAERSLN